jgi:phospholipid/cholesterol/gamma-HCH transport system substrate-binding protein
MKTTGSQKIKIGIFTLVGIGLLLAAIFFIGSKKNMFGDTFAIYGTFKNVGGLQLGNNVRFAGINVGTVEDITIINDTTVRVGLRMQSKVHRFLKSDAKAAIGSDGLMGDKLVTIAPGDTSNVILPSGGQIATVNPVDFDKVIGKLTRVVDNAELITGSLGSIFGEVSHGKGSLGKLIYSDSLERGLQSTVSAAHETMQSVKKGTEGFSDNMEALKHNFLLRGYYKKKAKEDAKKAKEAGDDTGNATDDSGPKTRKERREERKEKKKEAKEQKDTPAADNAGQTQ